MRNRYASLAYFCTLLGSSIHTCYGAGGRDRGNIWDLPSKLTARVDVDIVDAARARVPQSEAPPKAQAIAQPEAIVIDPTSRARFTVLTERLLRMEFSEAGMFEDRATITFINRSQPVPAYTTYVEDGELHIETSYLSLRYRTGQPFSSTSLSVTSISHGAKVVGKQWEWHPGSLPTGNLGGTYSSLDQIGSEAKPPLNVVGLDCSAIESLSVTNESLHCSLGVASRDGWALVNDTARPTLSATGWWSQQNGTRWAVSQRSCHTRGSGLVRWSVTTKSPRRIHQKHVLVPIGSQDRPPCCLLG
mmetsp:Transcript_26551/g.57733  ORF Transcript_26551/g.57733 Transcript_26551/m.57733 type:complete len:303 (+) Transcript_26551:158-1066(+)